MIGGPTRGLSVRRPGVGLNGPAPPPKGANRFTSVLATLFIECTLESEGRLTEFYDDYLNGYDDPSAPPVPEVSAPPDRVAAWARGNAGYPPSRNASRSAPNSSYTPSSFGGSVRRKPTRRATTRTPSRIQSTYEEEEEGYGSGEYDDGPFEMTLIRIKVRGGFPLWMLLFSLTLIVPSQLHYQDETRGMTLAPDTSFDEFMDRITAKFNKSLNGLGIKFKDEDGGKVTLRDESDFELAIETAREHSKSKPEGKLEIWCSDQ